jgi:hypothetical protein
MRWSVTTDLGRHLLQDLEGLLPPRRAQDVHVFVAQEALERLQDVDLVVDEENRVLVLHLPLAWVPLHR